MRNQIKTVAAVISIAAMVAVGCNSGPTATPAPASDTAPGPAPPTSVAATPATPVIGGTCLDAWGAAAAAEDTFARSHADHGRLLDAKKAAVAAYDLDRTDTNYARAHLAADRYFPTMITMRAAAEAYRHAGSEILAVCGDDITPDLRTLVDQGTRSAEGVIAVVDEGCRALTGSRWDC